MSSAESSDDSSATASLMLAVTHKFPEESNFMWTTT